MRNAVLSAALLLVWKLNRLATEAVNMGNSDLTYTPDFVFVCVCVLTAHLSSHLCVLI